MSAGTRPLENTTATNQSLLAKPTRRGTGLLLILTGCLVVVLLLGVGIGAVPIRPDQVFAILLKQIGVTSLASFEARQESVLMVIRLPRVVAGLLIGSSLAAAGAAIQGLFRNPLADPGLIGISSGSALAAALMIVLGHSIFSSIIALFGNLALPLAAFGGGVLTTLAIYRLATLGGRTNVQTMLLAGIAINALCGAGIGLLTYIATDAQLRDITFWSLGSLGRANWDMIAAMLPFMLPMLLLVFSPALARALNAMLLGEAEAGHIGINVERIKIVVVVLVALTVGAGVATAGIIGFIGLVVPHLIRLAVGPDHRILLPTSALLGAILLLSTDLLARTIAVPAEIPIGIVTALVGAPFFLWLLLKDRSRVSL